MKKLIKYSLILKKISLTLGLIVTVYSFTFPQGGGGFAALVLIPALITLVPSFFCFDYSDFHLKNKKNTIGITLFILGLLLILLFLYIYLSMFIG